MICYNCKQENTKVFCTNCGSIQPPIYQNHFDCFDLSISYEINPQQIEKTYSKLQKQFHPDLFGPKSELEKACAFKHTILINEAYNILLDDLKRSEYILKLNKIIVNADSTDEIKPPLELLHEIMELNMEIEESNDKTSLNIPPIKKQVLETLTKIKDNLKTYYANNNLQKAAIETIKFKYYTKIENELNQF
jgi:molecular chaperone HscB